MDVNNYWKSLCGSEHKGLSSIKSFLAQRLPSAKAFFLRFIMMVTKCDGASVFIERWENEKGRFSRQSRKDFNTQH